MKEHAMERIRRKLMILTAGTLLFIIGLTGVTRINIQGAVKDGKGLQTNGGIQMNDLVQAGTPDIIKMFYDYGERDISEDTRKKIYENMQKFYQLLALEDKDSLEEMSIDGRRIAIDIAKDMYALTGLNLYADPDGNINRITDQGGKVLYKGDANILAEKFDIRAFIISVVIILTMLTGLYVISRRSKYIKRRNAVHGVDSQRYA